MAFISSFLHPGLPVRRASQNRVPFYCAIESDDSNKPNRPRHPRRRDDFQPFDGSVPLLPAWRPPSIEAEFSYSARRVVSRENVSTEQHSRRMVKVESDGFGTLFAEVVQDVDDESAKVWLRPLLLQSQRDETCVDLRGGSDVFLRRSIVEDIDENTKTKLSINLMATEPDVLSRAMSDEQWNKLGSHALLSFIQGLSPTE